MDLIINPLGRKDWWFAQSRARGLDVAGHRDAAGAVGGGLSRWVLLWLGWAWDELPAPIHPKKRDLNWNRRFARPSTFIVDWWLDRGSTAASYQPDLSWITGIVYTQTHVRSVASHFSRNSPANTSLIRDACRV